MGVVIKQSFWGTLITYLGVAVGYINTLYLRPEFFEMEEIGLFTLITANAMMISPICSLGMGASFIKFFPALKDEFRNQFFTFQFTITLFANVMVIIAGFLLKEWIAGIYAESAPQYIQYLFITGVVIVVNSLFDLFFSYSRSILKVVFPSFLREIFLRIGSIFLVVGYALNWFSFDWAVYGLGITYGLVFILLYLQLVISHHFRFDFNFSQISADWKKRLFRFAFYSMGLAGSFAILNNATYSQVSSLLGPAANGIFTTCFFIGVIVEMPRRNMAKVMSPIISSEFEKQNMKEVDSLYKRSSITMSVIGILLFMGIITNLNDLFVFIPKGEQFETGFWVVTMVCAAKLVLMASSFPGEIINYSPLYRYNLIFQVGAAVMIVVMNQLVIPIWGLTGAGISYFAIITLHVIVKILFVQKYFHIQPFILAHIKLILAGLVIGALAWFWHPPTHPAIAIILRSIAITLVFIYLIYRLRISDDINKLIRSTFERFLNIKISK